MNAAPDLRAAAHVGRRARLELVFSQRRGRTVLAHAYAEPPLRVGRLFDAGSFAQLILVCAGPGVFAGDVLMQRVHVERGARVLLVSQSALQVHPSAADVPAMIDAVYSVEDGGELDCVWDPLIPFAGARVRQRLDLRLDAGSRLLWSDALMAGRVGSGEAWRFDTLDHELRVNVAESLVYLERYHLTPTTALTSDTPPDGTPRVAPHVWAADRAHYLGTTIVHDEQATATLAEQAQRELNTIDGLRAGVDCLTTNLVVARLLAARGPAFATAREHLRATFARLPLRR